MHPRSLALPAAALALAACVIAPVRPPPPPHMSGDEAARDGLAYCRSRGFACAVTSVQPRGPLWLVDLDASAPRAAGRMHVEFDMRDRRLVRADEPRPPPPPPPPPRPMNSDEAVGRAMDYCGHRGWSCRLLDADLAGGNVWRVNLDARRPGVEGRLHLEFDAISRNLLRADEPRPPPMPAPPRAMNSDEATRHGMDYCASRGYACRLLDADLVGGRLWRLNYEVGGRYVGRLHLELDAFTRALVNVNENVRAAY